MIYMTQFYREWPNFRKYNPEKNPKKIVFIHHKIYYIKLKSASIHSGFIRGYYSRKTKTKISLASCDELLDLPPPHPPPFGIKETTVFCLIFLVVISTLF